jgi:hypothetical protein
MKMRPAVRRPARARLEAVRAKEGAVAAAAAAAAMRTTTRTTTRPPLARGACAARRAAARPRVRALAAQARRPLVAVVTVVPPRGGQEQVTAIQQQQQQQQRLQRQLHLLLRPPGPWRRRRPRQPRCRPLASRLSLPPTAGEAAALATLQHPCCLAQRAGLQPTVGPSEVPPGTLPQRRVAARAAARA